MKNSQIEILKYIALFLMAFDHYAALNLAEEYRIIGRIVFPIFAFILVYNYIYNTSNKKNYIFRLFLFTLISQPFYYLVFEVNTINIFGTLTLGLLILYINEEHFHFKILPNILIILIVFPISLFIDYKFWGLLLIISFYIFLKNKNVLTFVLLLLSIYLINVLWNPIYSLFGIVALFIIYLVTKFDINIKRINKWFFYLFYPIHLLVLKII